MKNLYFVGVGAIVFVIAISTGCHGSGNTTLPFSNVAAHRKSSTCNPSQALTVCLRIAQSEAQITVTDTIGGDSNAVVGTATCPSSGSGDLCVVKFTPPPNTLNQIAISTGSSGTSGAFPVYVGAARGTLPARLAVLEGPSLIPISKIGVVPFQVSRPGAESRLALGQTQHVWVVASDAQKEVIIGSYDGTLSVVPSSNLTVSNTTLSSTVDAEHLTVGWNASFTTSSAGTGTMKVGEPSGVSGTGHLRATSGIIYDPVGPNKANVGPGPVALSSDGKTVYFAINDDSYGGCNRAPCATLLLRLRQGATVPDSVPLPSVPGVSQLYVSSNGALWIATFQPNGSWRYALPAFRISANTFTASDLQILPTAQFGSPSGFAEDSDKNLWISTCTGKFCKQDHNGTPRLVETSISGQPAAQNSVALKSSCLDAGYLGYSVGDVAAYHQGDLYVLGINDGSAPPARGNLWRVAPSNPQQQSCVAVPGNFNPSFYLSNLTDLSGISVLVAGAGGNDANFRWQPSHGFYIIREYGGSNSVRWDNGPAVTANHVSDYEPKSAPPGKVLYYASSGKLDLRFPGLGIYQASDDPATSPSPWGIFPSASFSGNQSDNGVAAGAHGAWYTASGVCGGWNGVCLAHAIYLSKADWGVLPSLILAPIQEKDNAAIGVITDPQAIGSGVSPLGAHSGPFYTIDHDPSVCITGNIKGGGKGKGTGSEQKHHAELIFGIVAKSRGTCRITIKDIDNNREQQIVTSVTPAP